MSTSESDRLVLTPEQVRRLERMEDEGGPQGLTHIVNRIVLERLAALTQCPCGCSADMHIGEIGCPCALPGEPPCTPSTSPASSTSGEGS